MGLFSFVKDAGEKLWDSVSGHKPEDQSAKLKEHLSQAGLTNIENVKIDVKDGVASVSGDTLTQELKEKILLVVGNVAGISSVEDKLTVQQATTSGDTRFYTVKSGDTLSGIAKTMYGNANLYNKIFEANKPMLTHPDKIYPGQVLRIPA